MCLYEITQNFTAIASPFLGVRTPLQGYVGDLWNILGARTLSTSGRQLFTIDKFRDTGRPLLSILADPDSIFIKGLAKFRRRTLYANVTNDRSVVYYTACIAKTDPYTDMTKVRVNYVEGYEDVILDPDHPVDHTPPHDWKQETLSEWGSKWMYRVPWIFGLGVFVPVGVVVFLANSAVQTVRSSKRIALHEQGAAGINIDDYRVPLLLNEIRNAVDGTYEELNSAQNQHYLGPSDEDSGSDSDVADGQKVEAANGQATSSSSLDQENETKARRASSRNILRLERKQSMPHQPTLALTPEQFEMIEGLDSVGWRKYPVWIHKHRHSHAAIIVRTEKESFSEGHVVMKHWLEEEFLV